MQALQEETDETARLVRTLELERLDTMQVAVWPRAVRGDLDAIGAMLKIMAHRMRLLNLDAPLTCAPTIPEGYQPAATPPWDEASAIAALTALIAAYRPGQAPTDPCVAY
jgi:hypothetical protein